VVISRTFDVCFLDDSQSSKIADKFSGEPLSNELLDLSESSLLPTRHAKHDIQLHGKDHVKMLNGFVPANQGTLLDI